MEMIDRKFYSCKSNNQIVKWFYFLEILLLSF